MRKNTCYNNTLHGPRIQKKGIYSGGYTLNNGNRITVTIRGGASPMPTSTLTLSCLSVSPIVWDGCSSQD